MCGQQNDSAFLDILQSFPKTSSRIRVHTCCRLIQKQHLQQQKAHDIIYNVTCTTRDVSQKKHRPTRISVRIPDRLAYRRNAECLSLFYGGSIKTRIGAKYWLNTKFPFIIKPIMSHLDHLICLLIKWHHGITNTCYSLDTNYCRRLTGVLNEIWNIKRDYY